MIYEYDAFIEVPEKLGEDKMAELDCAIAYFVEDEFGYPVEFSVLGQVDEKSGDCEIEKVVRCKECKIAQNNRYNSRVDGKNSVLCEHVTTEDGRYELKVFRNANDFCSYGKRREE